MRGLIYLILFVFVSPIFVMAQSGEGTSNGLGIIYNSEKAFKVRFQTNGFAASWNTGKIKTYYKTRVFSYEIGYLKSNREISQRFDFRNPFTSQASRSFVFGKQNSLYVLRAGIGNKRYYSDKAKRRGIAVGVQYEGGVSLGLLKPYYLELLRFKDNGAIPYISTEKYSEENKDLFTDITRVFGGASFFKGFDEVKPVPGLYLRGDVLFEWDAFEEYFAGMKAGFQLDVFPQTVAIMIDTPKQFLFLNLYITLELGKRK